MKISLEGFSVHGLLRDDRINLFGYLEAIRYRYHLQAAGIWNGLFASTDEAYIAVVKEELQERQVTVPNIAFDQCSVWADKPEDRDANRQRALRNIEIAAELGAETVRIDWGVTKPTLTDEQMDVIVVTFREYCDLAQSHGMKLGPENHFGAALDPELQLQVLQAVDHPAYGILLHYGHWDRLEEQGDEMVVPYTMHTHIPANMVRDHFDAICRTSRLLMNAGYEGYYGVEHHTATHEYAQIGWQIGEIRRMLTFVEQNHAPIHSGSCVNPLLGF